MISSFLNNPLGSWFLTNLDFSFPQTSTLRCMYYSILFSSSDTPLFLYSILHSIFKIFGFFLSSHYILLTYYLLKPIRHDVWIKALEIKASIVFDLVFASEHYFMMHFLLFLDNWLILLIPAVTAQIFSLNGELQHI